MSVDMLPGACSRQEKAAKSSKGAVRRRPLLTSSGFVPRCSSLSLALEKALPSACVSITELKTGAF